MLVIDENRLTYGILELIMDRYDIDTEVDFSDGKNFEDRFIY